MVNTSDLDKVAVKCILIFMNLSIIGKSIQSFFKKVFSDVRNSSYIVPLLIIIIGGNALLFLGVRKEIIGLIIGSIGSLMIGYAIIRIRFR